MNNKKEIENDLRILDECLVRLLDKFKSNEEYLDRSTELLNEGKQIVAALEQAISAKNSLIVEQNEKILKVEGERNVLLSAIEYLLNDVIDKYDIRQLEDFECPFMLNLAVRYQVHLPLGFVESE